MRRSAFNAVSSTTAMYAISSFSILWYILTPSPKNIRVSAPLIRSGGPFTSKVGLLRAGHPVFIRANSEVMLVSVRGELRIQTTCSINAANADDFKLSKLAVEGLDCPVFIRSGVKPTK